MTTNMLQRRGYPLREWPACWDEGPEGLRPGSTKAAVSSNSAEDDHSRSNSDKLWKGEPKLACSIRARASEGTLGV